jgi:hypothetical protein
MRKLIILLSSVILVLAFNVGWQVGASVLANIELRDDLQDLASQLGNRVGLSSPISDDEFRRAVIDRAGRYDIELAPDQVTVERTGYGVKGAIYLQVHYSVEIHAPGYAFTMNFAPESGKPLYP